MLSSPEPRYKIFLKVEMKRRRSRKMRKTRSSRRRRTRQRGGMQSPIKEAEIAGVPIVAGPEQAVVFRTVDRKDPHGATKASFSIGDVAREYDTFAADPA